MASNWCSCYKNFQSNSSKWLGWPIFVGGGMGNLHEKIVCNIERLAWKKIPPPPPKKKKYPKKTTTWTEKVSLGKKTLKQNVEPTLPKIKLKEKWSGPDCGMTCRLCWGKNWCEEKNTKWLYIGDWKMSMISWIYKKVFLPPPANNDALYMPLC